MQGRSLINCNFGQGDYREFLELVVVSLGREVPNFKFKLPGADHHARWMSKGIYYVKIWLLSRVFVLSEEEKQKVERIFKFVVVFYAKAWFLAPLPASAARNDLQFQYNMLRYRELEPMAVWKVLPSIKRHHWYLTAQLIPLALCDPGLETEERELLAKTIFNTPREHITTGRPDFPDMVWDNPSDKRPSLHTVVNSNSWLMFEILGLQKEQKPEWLQVPSSMWYLFADYRKLEEFTFNLSVTNDVAERGVRLITDFLNKTHDESQRQALLQTVEFFRELVPNMNKCSLANC